MINIIRSAYIPGGERRYRARTDGTIWTRYISGGNGKLGSWRKLKSHVSKQRGYPEVKIKLNGKMVTRYVHSLILLTFRGPRPKGMQTRHFPDKTKTNCALNNLSYGTHKENEQDKKTHNSHAKGERHGKSKLTWKIVRRIRWMAKTKKFSQRKLGRIFGLTQGHVCNILKNKIWRE